MSPPRLADLLREGTARLTEAAIPDAPRDARKLLAFAAGIDPGRLTLHLSDPVGDAAAFHALIDRRLQREPVSHLVGGREFYGRWFTVTPDVLDPRPETETLIEAALAAPFERVLDLGTGSGAILLTLLAERPEASGVGADISDRALMVAARNAEALGVANRALLLKSDWATRVEGTFDLVVSNPPYIAEEEMLDLSPEVRLWEPRMALTDEADGLMAYRAITSDLRILRPGGLLAVEIGPTQGAAVAALFAAAGLEGIAVIPDLDGRDRVVVGHRLP